jgi:hypothetical protein
VTAEEKGRIAVPGSTETRQHVRFADIAVIPELYRRNLIIEHHGGTLQFVCPCGRRLTWSIHVTTGRTGQQFNPLPHREDIERKLIRVRCECGNIHWKRWRWGQSAAAAAKFGAEGQAV